MTQYKVPSNCIGLTLPNGQKVDSNRRGIVNVPDRFDRDVQKSQNTERGLVTSANRISFLNVRGHECSCGSSIFAWQKQCRTCADKKEVER
jgi:hypothetical protein